ncbi:flagellar M-ring protein FliF, partial [bacterium]|nr:flagellar M-ring protein FliF [bacterium]
MDELVERLREFWQSLGATQKIVVLVVPAALLVGALAAVVLVVSAPEVKVILFSNLDNTDAMRIIQELESKGVDYAFNAGGGVITVPASEVYQVRLEVAEKGLVENRVGFEIFDKPRLGMTQKEFMVMERRATQGALERTLEAFEQVEWASVLLSLAPQSSFLNKESESTAAVVLKLNPGMWLSRSNVTAIRNVVSYGVPNLEPKNVSVADSTGNPLSGPGGFEAGLAEDGHRLSEQQRIRRQLEDELQQQILTVLEPEFGDGNVSAAVFLEMKFDQVHRESEEYSPVVDMQGIETHIEERREKTTNGAHSPGGIPGTSSNI